MKRYGLLLLVILLLSLSVFSLTVLSVDKNIIVKNVSIHQKYFISPFHDQGPGKRFINDDEVIAFISGPAGCILFTPSGAHLRMITFQENTHHLETQVFKRKDAGASECETGTDRDVVVFKMGLKDVDTQSTQISLEDKTNCVFHFYENSEENWRTHLPTYKKLTYKYVNKGVAIDYFSYSDRLESQLIIEPGVDVRRLKLETGAQELFLESGGCLTARFNNAKLILGKPIAFQENNNVKLDISVNYKIFDDCCYSFELGDYDPDLPLFIGTALEWDTLLSGSVAKYGLDIAVADDGNTYIIGHTYSPNLSVVTGNSKPTLVDDFTVFITKLSSNGSNEIYNTIQYSAAMVMNRVMALPWTTMDVHL